MSFLVDCSVLFDYKPDVAISYSYAIFAALFWGAGFIGSRFGLEAFTPMWVTFFRFLIAGIFLLPLLKDIKKEDLNKTVIGGAFACGLVLAFIIFLQVKGLQYTTVAKSSFITITYAFMTPVICSIFFKEKLSYVFWSTVGMALFGILLICDMNISSLNYGDFLTFIVALISSVHLLLVSHYATKLPRLAVFNILQMFSVCAISFTLAMIFEGTAPLTTGVILQDYRAISGLVFMGVFSTSIAFMLQTKSQKVFKPYIAGLIFLLESPFAAILGYFTFKETLTPLAITGCVLVMAAVGVVPFEQQIISAAQAFKAKLTLRPAALRLARPLVVISSLISWS